jgi:hypothetical protein
MKLIAHPRMPFCAPEGKVIIEADFSAQELRLGAALSKDPVMTVSFTSDEFIYDTEGNPCPNPAADLHCMSAVRCVLPSWFEEIPETQWVKRSKEVPPGAKRTPRDDAKVLNFARVLAK